MRRSVLVWGMVLGVLAMPAVAAPVPKKKRPPVVVTLTQSDIDPNEISVSVTNNTADPLTWQSSTIPLARIGLGVTDERGDAVTILHPCALCSPHPLPGHTTTVAPGETLVMKFGLANCFPGVRPKGNLTMAARFRYDEAVYDSAPLAVK